MVLKKESVPVWIMAICTLLASLWGIFHFGINIARSSIIDEAKRYTDNQVKERDSTIKRNTDKVNALRSVLPDDMAKKYDSLLESMANIKVREGSKRGLAGTTPAKDNPNKPKGPTG